MVLYYAPGGGLGHLTRANAFICTMGYRENDFLILTSSNYAKLIFKESNIILLAEELYDRPHALRSEIEMYLSEFQIEIFYIDSFPAGINGELINLKINQCKLRYIARLLNWTNYSKLIENYHLQFDTTYIIEILTDNHLSFIFKYSKENRFVNLQYPITNNHILIEKVISEFERPIWLIVHSESAEELNTLIMYAQDLAEMKSQKPEYLVISQTSDEFNRLPLKCISYYPASDFFPIAEKIFTGCGFNVMAQTTSFINKHYFIPFLRRFDDQFLRARFRKQLIGKWK